MRARSAIAGWTIAVSVYLLAVLNRSSLGVSALRAEQRFHISPGQLSTFVILQLGVYAAMQIPTGVLVDRYGPRRLLVVAATLMALAQLGFALAPNYGTALLARGLLGCGDALTFVSVLRFSVAHFSPARYPLIVSASALVGISGNVIATLPLTVALRSLGWGWSFGIMAAATGATAALVLTLLPSDPVPVGAHTTPALLRAQIGRVLLRVGASWTHPGTRLGFWLHFACMSTPTALGVLWGYPYLVGGLGFSADGASTTLLLSVVIALVAILTVGWLISSHPVARVPMAFAVCVLVLTGWVVLLVQSPAEVPHWYAAGLICFTTVGGPASSVAFALARDYNGPKVVGTASGVVNVGGFIAAIIAALLMGAVLDVSGTTATGYRAGVTALLSVQLVGTVMMGRWWLRARATNLVAITEGRSTPIPMTRHRWDRVVGRPPR